MDIQFNFYDKSKIGKLIAWGGEHFVYDYGDDEVIKFSVLAWLIGKKGRAKIIRDCQINLPGLSNYLLPTRVVVSQDGARTAVIQKKISGKYLAKKDFIKESIKNQFKEILAGFDYLLETKNLQIDLVGTRGVFSGNLSNIFVTSEDKLVIIDATIIEFEGAGLFYPILSIIKKVAEIRQMKILISYRNLYK